MTEGDYRIDSLSHRVDLVNDRLKEVERDQRAREWRAWQFRMRLLELGIYASIVALIVTVILTGD